MKLLFNLLSVILILLDHSASGVGPEEVSVMEGDSVTLKTGVKTREQLKYDIRWYYNDTRIAEITGGQSQICTDVQCKKRFRDRLKLDHQSGNLTIMNITNTDSGVYRLQISSSSSSGNIFRVSVHGVSAAERDKAKIKSVKGGESVTFDPAIPRKLNYLVKLYFNDILIAEFGRDHSNICTDVRCEERFRDRLKLDNQTGSLTITNTRKTDSGVYHLQIIISNSSFRINRVERFSVYVINLGLSAGAIVGICVGVLVSATVIYFCCCRKSHTADPHTAVPQNEGDADNPPPDPNAIPLRGMDHSSNKTQAEAPNKTMDTEEN